MNNHLLRDDVNSQFKGGDKTRYLSAGFRVAALVLTVILSVFVTSAVLASSTRIELYRLASDLHYTSDQLSDELKRARGFSTASRHAKRLSRDARYLLESINRNRSNSTIRSRFSTVIRQYTDLESAYLRSTTNYRNDFSVQGITVVSNLVSDLSYAFDGLHYYERSGVNIHLYNNRSSYQPYRGSGGSYGRDQRYNNQRYNNQRYNNNRYSNSNTTIHNRGRNNGHSGNRQTQQPDRSRRDRVNDFDHRSPVLDRQAVGSRYQAPRQPQRTQQPRETQRTQQPRNPQRTQPTHQPERTQEAREPQRTQPAREPERPRQQSRNRSSEQETRNRRSRDGNHHIE